MQPFQINTFSGPAYFTPHGIVGLRLTGNVALPAAGDKITIQSTLVSSSDAVNRAEWQAAFDAFGGQNIQLFDESGNAISLDEIVF